MPTSWNEAIVSDIIDHNDSVKSIFLETRKKFTFTPGQFIVLDLPIAERRTKRWRSYSLANAPNDPRLELCVQYVSDGLASEYFWNDLSVGTELRFKDAQGSFVLPEDLLTHELVMVCTGTGVAPFRSMIRSLIHNRQSFRQLHLIYGSRYRDNILYREEFEAYQEKLPNFYYDVALSKDKEWQGCKGYVHQIYLEKYAKNSANRRFLLCGWSAMIDDAVANLLIKLKYDPSQVKYELYG